MKDEIREAVAFLKQFIAKYGQLDQSQIDIIANMLTVALQERFVNHWYEDMPLKGQAFRCLRLKRSEDYIDPDLDKILRHTGLKLGQLGLPNDFTLWIDPGEVSVRFGEQNGLGFTIARLNQQPSAIAAISAANPYERPSQSPSKHAVAPKLSPAKSSLIVENAEKMFDEKLTAFIRQNSAKCSVLIDESASDVVVEQSSSSLSAEKRTISPPLSSAASAYLSKRPNSSNISISPKSEVEVNKIIGSRAKADRNSLNMPSRLSYNDSCYYSSSSSSCASSYESNRSEHILQAGWNNSNSGKSQPLSTSFNDKLLSDSALQHQFNSELTRSQMNPVTMPKVLKDDDNQVGSRLTTNLAFMNQSTGLDAFGKGLYGLDFEDNNNPFSHLSATYSNTLLFSDASSDRSDTPSSCITTASTASYLIGGPSSSPSLSNAFHDARRVEAASSLHLNPPFSRPSSSSSKILGTNNNMSNFDSSSSSAASTMTVSNQLDENDGNDFKENQANEDELKRDLLALTGEESKKTEKVVVKKTGGKKKKGEAKKEKKEKPTALATSPSSDKKSTPPQPPAAGEKKEDTYCGYVESFPYYYKLNRLYNALAVQKMQTERMKKSNTSLVGSPTSSASPTPFPPGIRHPGGGGPGGMAKNGGAPGTSPAQYPPPNRYMMVSPSPSPMGTSPKQGLSPMAKTGQASSPANNLGSFMNNSVQGANNNYNLMSPMFANNNSNNSNNNLTTLKPSAALNGQAYPMSPANAALSFANHQNRHGNHQRNSSSNSALSPSNLSLLLSNQFSHLSTNSSPMTAVQPPPAANNNTFGLNIDSLFSSNNVASNLDNNSSSLFAQPTQSAQQMMNMFGGQMSNWMRGGGGGGQSDMLRTNN